MSLLLQLSAAILLIVIVTAIHGTGVVATTKLFRYEDRALRGLKLASREFRLMVPMALCLFALHAIEILIFALFYLAVGESLTLEDALFLSGSAYTTIGVGDRDVLKWKLVPVFEGLAGFLLIGWSAAVFVTDMERVLGRKQTES
jgi:hypothetical protein